MPKNSGSIPDLINACYIFWVEFSKFQGVVNMSKYSQMVANLTLDDLFKIQTYQEINLDKWQSHEMKNTDLGKQIIAEIKNKLQIIQQQIDYKFEHCIFSRN